MDFNLRLADETEHIQLEPERLKAGVDALLRDRGRGLYYLAEANGAIVGQVMITYEWSDWRNGNIWWLQSVYVHPQFRGRGVFKALFGHLQQLAATAGGVSALRLYMHAENSRARACYERLGMAETKYQVFELSFQGGAD